MVFAGGPGGTTKGHGRSGGGQVEGQIEQSGAAFQQFASGLSGLSPVLCIGCKSDSASLPKLVKSLSLRPETTSLENLGDWHP